MPKNLTVYSCLIISPSDVTEARDAAVSVVENWNAHVGAGLGARVEAIRWETHARPEMGAPAQEVINQQLVDQCDFGVAVFWSRLGSPTAMHPSGSTEEVDRLLRRGSKVMVYFSSAPIPQEALKDDQYARLQELRKRYQQEGLLATYSSTSELREQLHLHLTSLVTELLLNTRAAGQPIPSTGTLTAPLPDIRVNVASALANGGTGLAAVISVTIENHSPNDWFFSSIMFELSDGEWLFFERDVVTGELMVARKIEPGNSLSFHVDPRIAEGAIKRRKIVAALAKDQIGRVYRSRPGDMEDAMTGFVQFCQMIAEKHQ